MVDTRPVPDAGQSAPTASRSPALRVYVADGCGGCRRARELVAQLLLRCPGAAVEVVNVSRTPPEQPLPTGLVGTPTYTVDGRVRWLGNPSPQELLEVVEGRRS